MDNNGRSWEMDSVPSFNDVPFKESEWFPLIEQLINVNQPKARLVQAFYDERLRPAWKEYLNVIEREEESAKGIRESIIENNLQLDQTILALFKQLKETIEKWQPALTEKRHELEQAENAAFMASARSGIDLRGNPRWDKLFGGDSETDLSSTESSTPEPPKINGTDLEVKSLRHVPIPPITDEEIAHQENMMTFRDYVVPKLWKWQFLTWLILTFVVGAQLSLVLGMGAKLFDLPFYKPDFQVGELASQSTYAYSIICLLFGVVSAAVWYRMIWGIAAIGGEAFHVDWKPIEKAHKIGWLTGTLLLVLFTTVIGSMYGWTVLMSRTFADTEQGHSDWSLFVYLSLMLSVLPYFGCATVDGFLRGRSQWVQRRINAQTVEKLRQISEQKSATIVTEPLNDIDKQNGLKEHISQPLSDWEIIRHYHAISKQYASLESDFEKDKNQILSLINSRESEKRHLPEKFTPEAKARMYAAKMSFLNCYSEFFNLLGDSLKECAASDDVVRIIQRFGSMNTGPKGGINSDVDPTMIAVSNG